MTLFGAVANIFLTWLLLIREKKNGIQYQKVPFANWGKRHFFLSTLGKRQGKTASVYFGRVG